jgi:molecular chaperone GrpE
MSEKESRSREEQQEKQQESEDAEVREESEGTSEGGGQEPSLSHEELEALCKERICPECPTQEEKNSEVLRIKADAENYRKRMTREKEEYVKYAEQKLLEDILPVIDNLELAIQHGRQVEACKDLVQGVEMTIKMFQDTVKRYGLEPVETQQGEAFDPGWHEALYEEQREDMETGQVCQVLQKGYKLKDRLVRPSKVIVSRKCESSENS